MNFESKIINLESQLRQSENSRKQLENEKKQLETVKKQLENENKKLITEKTSLKNCLDTSNRDKTQFQNRLQIKLNKTNIGACSILHVNQVLITLCY
jgi:chromosome segregation ATPase